jgi:hypothetical protein
MDGDPALYLYHYRHPNPDLYANLVDDSIRHQHGDGDRHFQLYLHPYPHGELHAYLYLYAYNVFHFDLHRDLYPQFHAHLGGRGGYGGHGERQYAFGQ